MLQVPEKWNWFSIGFAQKLHWLTRAFKLRSMSNNEKMLD